MSEATWALLAEVRSVPEAGFRLLRLADTVEGARQSGRFMLGVARRLQRGYRVQIRADKRTYFDAVGAEAAKAAECNDSRRIFEL